MNKVSLPYGINSLEWTPPLNNVTFYECNNLPHLENLRRSVKSSLENPIASAPLKDIAKPADKLVIILSDSARIFPQDIILEAVLEELSHIPPKQITLIVANGNHGNSSPSKIGISEEIQKKYKIINHNSLDLKSTKVVGTILGQDREFFVLQALRHFKISLANIPRGFFKLIRAIIRVDIKGLWAAIGYTAFLRSLFIFCGSANNEIRINKETAEADLRILIGQIKPHFLSGFSGGLKAVFPGCAHQTCIAKNHSMMNHPSVDLGKNEDNIIRTQIEKGASFCGKSFAVNVVLNGDHKVAGVFSGDPIRGQREGSNLCWKIAGINAKKSDIVITSEGFPEAINLYQLIKIIPPAAKIVKAGGAIICVGSCRDGIGGLLVVNEITCKIGFWHLLPKDVRLYLVSDIAEREVNHTQFIYASSIDEALRKERKRVGETTSIAVLKGAGLMIPK